MTQDEQIELMCVAWWDAKGPTSWQLCPEDWKPDYRRRMKAALETIDGINSLIGDSE